MDSALSLVGCGVPLIQAAIGDSWVFGELQGLAFCEDDVFLTERCSGLLMGFALQDVVDIRRTRGSQNPASTLQLSLYQAEDDRLSREPAIDIGH